MWGWWSHWQRTVCSLNAPCGSVRDCVGRRTGRTVSTRYRCFDVRSVTKRRPELVVQRLADVNVRMWSFPAGEFLPACGSPSAGVSLFVGGVPLLTGARWCAFSDFVPEIPVVPADVVVGRRVVGVLRWTLDCERWRSLNCERLRVCDARSDATWRASSSVRSSSTAVFSGVAGEMLAMVGWGVTSQIFSAK
jgi:hypothetical protein